MRRGSIVAEGADLDGDFRTSIQGSPDSRELAPVLLGER
jgi:hypothetical protein